MRPDRTWILYVSIQIPAEEILLTHISIRLQAFDGRHSLGSTSIRSPGWPMSADDLYALQERGCADIGGFVTVSLTLGIE